MVRVPGAALRVVWGMAGRGVGEGASAVLTEPSMKRIPADARGCHAAGSRVADEAADRSCPVVHRPVVPRLLRPGVRFPGADREADGVRDAGRDGPCPLLEP